MIREKIRVALYVQKAALTFLDAVKRELPSPKVPPDPPYVVKQAGFSIDANELASLVHDHDLERLQKYRGVDGLFRLLSVAASDGVSTTSLPCRQEIFGSNHYVEKPSRGFWMYVWDAVQDLTLIILIVCAFMSLIVGLSTEGWPNGIYDGLGIVLSIFLVVIITAVSDYRQSLQFKDLDKEKKKIEVQVTRDGCRQKVSIFDLVVGDIVHLSIGDRVPADGLFISGYSLVVDESSLSGESEPAHISDEKPFLLSGTNVQDGFGKMLVTSVGMRTEWGKLMETLSQEGEDETPLQVKLNGVATIIGKIGTVFSVLTFSVLLARFLSDKAFHEGLMKWSSKDASDILGFFATAVTIVVVAVPEGLPLAVTLSLAFAMKKLMSDKALVRRLSACETMGSASCICTDKTGTLTTNHMVVDKIWICELSEVCCTRQTVNRLKSLLSTSVQNFIFQCIFLNSSSEVAREKDGKKVILGTPTESALLEFGVELGGDSDAQRKDCLITKVEPFNSNNKKMSMLVSLPGGGIRAFCKGAPEVVLMMCDKILDVDGNIVSLSEKQKTDAMGVVNVFANETLRTLCVAFMDMDVAKNQNDIPTEGYVLVAIFGIKDPIRPGVKEAVEMCKAAGITVRMVTGDNICTAKAIAKECGILTEGGMVIEGAELRNWCPQEMMNFIPKVQVMARSLPMDKHTLVTNLRKMHKEVVAVTGDGINDAPALHEADIGFAMGIAGTEVAKENADVIVMDDNFTTIIDVARWGRAVYLNIQKFVQFQLTVNVVALMVNFISACVSGHAPLTVVQLLWVNIIMDTLGALALATEPPDDTIMKRPPVGRMENLITRIMWRNILGQSMYQLSVFGFLMFNGEDILKIKGPNAEAVLNTFIFNTFVLCQVFNEINSRDMEKINVFRGFFRSWIFSFILISTVIFQIVIVEYLGTFASTVPLPLELWLLSVIIGSMSMVIAVFLKCIPILSTHRTTILQNNGYGPLPSGPEDI